MKTFIRNYSAILLVFAFLVLFVVPPAIVWPLYLVRDFFVIENPMIREGVVGLSALAGLMLLYGHSFGEKSDVRLLAVRSASLLILVALLLLGYICLSIIDTHCKEGAVFTKNGFEKENADLLSNFVLSKTGQLLMLISVSAHMVISAFCFLSAIFFLLCSFFPSSVRSRLYRALPSLEGVTK